MSTYETIARMDLRFEGTKYHAGEVVPDDAGNDRALMGKVLRRVCAPTPTPARSGSYATRAERAGTADTTPPSADADD